MRSKERDRHVISSPHLQSGMASSARGKATSLSQHVLLSASLSDSGQEGRTYLGYTLVRDLL